MKKWFVVRTKMGAEEKAVWHLKNQNFEVYLPRYRKQVRHARKTLIVLRPLFPGYLFLQMDTANQRWRSINGTFGVLNLVQFGGAHQYISDAIVEEIRSNEQNGIVSIEPKGLNKGDRVLVREGAFTDYTALLEEVSDDKRVILLLNLMGREVRVTAPMENLAKVS